MRDDSTLLREFAERRCQEAFAELVRRHIDGVYSAALRRVGGDTHLAEDVTQQVFAAVARKASSIARHPQLSAWLYVTTRNEAANIVRAERRRKNREQEAVAMSHIHSEEGATLDWTRVGPVIDAAIDGLGETDRAAILLRYVENRPFADIGRALRVSEDAARMRVDRALDRLQLLLKRRGIESSAAALGLALSTEAVHAAPAALASAVTTVSIAAPAGAASPAVAVIELMTTGKAATIFAAAVLAASLGSAAHQIGRYREAGASLARTETDIVELTALQRDLESRIANVTRDAAKAATSNPTNKGGANRPNASKPKTSANAARASGDALMARYPAVRQALIDWANASTNFEYIGFYESAELAPAQIAAFQRLRQEGYAMSQLFGPDQQDVSFSLTTGRSWEQIERETRELLGTEGYRKYQEYGSTIPARHLATQIAAALSFGSAPLSSAQFDRLVRSMTDSHCVQNTPSGQNVDWPAITREAREVLSPDQRKILDAVRSQSEYDQLYSRKASANRPAEESKS